MRAALHGEPTGFVAGITWLPNEVLETVADSARKAGPAQSLATIASALSLDFALVPSAEPWAAEAARELREQGVASVWSVSGVLSRVGDRIGWAEMLRMTVAEPGGLAAHMGEVLHDAMDAVRSGLAEGADAVLVADDVAGATGPLVSPDFVLDGLVPCYRSLAELATAGDIPAVFHSDGDVRAFFPALWRVGFSAVHLASLAPGPFVSSYAAARSAGLAVMGGIETVALGSGARRVGSRAADVALSCGMLICDDGGITSAEELAAYASALDSARETYASGGVSAEDEL
jgi:Uroporphyrinogen decarboxylase (URO-D)